MPLALRPYATTGIVITGAGLLAIAPLAGSLPAVPEVQSRDVQLASTFDEVFTTASENFTTLYNNFALAPFVGLQQAIVNQQDLWQSVADGTTTVPEAFQQIQTSFETVSSAFALTNMGLSDEDFTDVVNNTLNHSLDGLHKVIVSLLPSFLPSDIDPDQVTGILHLLSSPASAMFMGTLGPVISPLVALGNDLSSGNFADIPSDMLGGLLNGATLNLDSLIPLINDADILPEGTSINSLDFAFGGLLSPGVVSVPGAPYSFPDGPDVDPVGGSLFNSLGLNITTELAGTPITLDIPSHGIGPIGAMEAWSQTIGVLLGDGWDGKNADQVPPIFGLDPIVPPDAMPADATDAMLGMLGLSDIF